MINKVKADLDNFVVYIQRFIETQLNWQARIARLPYKQIEDKLETIEWSLRHAEFISSEEHQKFLISFRDIYSSSDVNVRNLYITANHLNDSVVYANTMLDQEIGKLDFQMTAASESKAAAEKKINIALIALESLIVNDKNLDLGIENGVLQTLVKVIRWLPSRGVNGG